MRLRTLPVTLINSPFVTFAPVNSAQIEIQLGKQSQMKVKQIVFFLLFLLI
jgi:hypothetical protein